MEKVCIVDSRNSVLKALLPVLFEKSNYSKVAKVAVVNPFIFDDEGRTIETAGIKLVIREKK